MPSKGKNAKKEIDSVKLMSTVSSVINFIKEQAVVEMKKRGG